MQFGLNKYFEHKTSWRLYEIRYNKFSVEKMRMSTSKIRSSKKEITFIRLLLTMRMIRKICNYK
jgi:hypothetical protein